MKLMSPLIPTILFVIVVGTLTTRASSPWNAYPEGADFALSGTQHTISTDFPIQKNDIRVFQQSGQQLVPLNVEALPSDQGDQSLVLQLPEVQRIVRWIALIPSAVDATRSLHTIVILPADSLPNLRGFAAHHRVYLDIGSAATLSAELDANEIRWHPISQMGRIPEAGSLLFVTPDNPKLEQWKESHRTLTIVVLDMTAKSASKKTYRLASTNKIHRVIKLSLPPLHITSSTGLLHMTLDYIAADATIPTNP